MPLPFLEVFPREIRDQIYTYILASPFGSVNLSHWIVTVDVARSLSLLRTCKQIHRECKDIIWQHNKLSLREPTQLFQKFNSLARNRHVRHIRQVNLYLELLDRDELEWMRDSLKPLAGWSYLGRLESIRIATVWEKPTGIEEFKEVLNLRKYGESLDGRLYHQSNTWTRMTVNTGWPRFTHWGKQRWLKEMLLDPSGTSELLKEIHDTFGGKLYVDGFLCFKDHRQVVVSPRLDPRDGEIRIVPGLPSSRQMNAIYT
jgi:hypothetical protein